MEIVLCAVQPHLAAAWRERIGADLSNCVRVVEGDILSLDVLAAFVAAVLAALVIRLLNL